ncbi:hypothetical protein GC089_14630 [Cellulomonas sp. JZ18]|uniref:hypothetical protein n=1 Tax=Cellulomonas sp. JZ18 TaxID=2654191 RepID=UPI0012D37FB6|nr:hypothetical protein [Cellulomonas sp. JZ18]QGQ20210.1 hypothetical protein GC089_14630 [Cellulomonas sp. JZ18]
MHQDGGGSTTTAAGAWARWARRWAWRWVSPGGIVTAVGLGNLVAALNWNAIAKGQAAATQSFAQASAASDRYALWGFALLVVGQAMVTRRTLDEPAD